MPRRKKLRSARFVRRERRKKVRKILALSFLLAAVLSAVGYGFSRPSFRLRSIEVIGSSKGEEKLVESAATEILSETYLGFIPKSHTLLYPKSALKESLLKQFPNFSSVTLSLKSLSALRILVHEREPLALWCVSLPECFLLDTAGIVFAEAEAGMEEIYYRLLKSGAEPSLGAEVIEPEKLSDLLLFLKKLEAIGLPPKEVLLKEQNELEAALLSGTRLLLRAGDYDQTLIKLETLLGQDNLFSRDRGELSVAYIDLRYGNKIYFKPR
jgi:cell division septal protein FtsQ